MTHRHLSGQKQWTVSLNVRFYRVDFSNDMSFTCKVIPFNIHPLKSMDVC